MKKSGILLAFLIAVSSSLALQAAPAPTDGSTKALSSTASASSEGKRLIRKSEGTSSTSNKPPLADSKKSTGSKSTGTSSESQKEETSSETAVQTKPATKKTSEKNFLTRTENQILAKLNKERADLGLGKLTINEDLQAAARLRSKELYQAKKFWHKRPNGDKWETVIQKDVPIKFLTAGENLCMTEYNDPNCTNASSASFWTRQWFDSPEHYENIIRPEFDHIGVGVYSIKKNGTTYAYATTIFAHLPPAQ